jgi:hypothetical protein
VDKKIISKLKTRGLWYMQNSFFKTCYDQNKSNPTIFDFSRVSKECFWDMNISESEVMNIITGQDFRKKQFIFEKILLNSTKLFKDLKVFDIKDLKTLLDKLDIPQFNSGFILRRKNLVDVYFFDAELLIEELKWVA